MKEISFKGQTAIVTGAGRGLGRAYAFELARRGASVIVNDLGVDGATSSFRADSVVAEIISAGGDAVASHHDISEPDTAQQLIDLAMERFGAIDVLINNAGFLRPGSFENLDTDDVRDVMRVHLLGAFHVTQPAWRVMQAKGYGRIVMTGSASSFGHHSNSNYGAAKAGVLGLTQSLALEGEEYGIGVNCVFPVSETEITTSNPLTGPAHSRLIAGLKGLHSRRPPTSVAHLVVYLASRDCSVSGRTYSAMAGRYARVFLGVSDGWMSQDISTVSAEDIAQHFGEINSLSHFTVPAMVAEEIENVVARIRR